MSKSVTVDAEEFQIIHHGLIIGSARSGNRNLPILKRELSILDELEKNSKAGQFNEAIGGNDLIPSEAALTLYFSEEEINLLVEYISNTPWRLGRFSRLAVALISKLENA